jgi:phosphopantetheinyl transferase (holo-ACP synthase)
VLTAKERLLVQVSHDPDRMLWSLWAAKEAAFKALSRQNSAMVFSPVRLEVDPNPGGPTALVAFEGRTLSVIWTQGPGWVHAVVSSDQSLVKAEVERRVLPGDESEDVRRLAVQALRRAGYPAGSIEGSPPVYRWSTDQVLVSLSHDGPYAAVAFPVR